MFGAHASLFTETLSLRLHRPLESNQDERPREPACGSGLGAVVSAASVRGDPVSPCLGVRREPLSHARPANVTLLPSGSCRPLSPITPRWAPSSSKFNLFAPFFLIHLCRLVYLQSSFLINAISWSSVSEEWYFLACLLPINLLLYIIDSAHWSLYLASNWCHNIYFSFNLLDQAVAHYLFLSYYLIFHLCLHSCCFINTLENAKL